MDTEYWMEMISTLDTKKNIHILKTLILKVKPSARKKAKCTKNSKDGGILGQVPHKKKEGGTRNHNPLSNDSREKGYGN